MSIAYVAAVMFFLVVYSRLTMARRFEWLFAITAMGGMGVVSLKTGNFAIAMNFTLLALVLDAAAMGSSRSLILLPIAIAAGALIKPQFLLYLGLLVLVRPLRSAAMRMAGAALAVLVVHVAYIVSGQQGVERLRRQCEPSHDDGKGLRLGIGGVIYARRELEYCRVRGVRPVVLFCVAALSYVAWQRQCEAALVCRSCRRRVSHLWC